MWQPTRHVFALSGRDEAHPLFSEMRRDATFATAFGTRMTGNFRSSNQ
jgi:hypothetical protein